MTSEADLMRAALDATYRALEPKIVRETCPFCAGRGFTDKRGRIGVEFTACKPCAGRGFINTEAP